MKLIQDKLVKARLVKPTTPLTINQLDGLSNLTYKIESPQLAKPLVLKQYKNTFDMFVSRRLQGEIIDWLVERKRHPRVLHSEEGWRVQEYLEGKSLTGVKVDQQTLLVVTKILGEFSRDCKVKNTGLVDRSFNSVKQKGQWIYREVLEAHRNKIHPDTSNYIESMFNRQFTQRISSLLPQTMVLSHNDSNMTNCIWDASNNHLTLIDYEFATNNYIGFDLGNLINQAATQYDNTFQIRSDWQIDHSNRTQLTRSYFQHLGLGVPLPQQQRLVDVGRLLSHHFWAFIGVLSFKDEDCTLDLNYYVKRRFEQIHKLLHKLSHK